MNTTLAKAIEDKGIKKEKIAQEINVTPGMITHYLNGTKLPRVDRAIKIAKILGTTVEKIFSREGETDK